MNKWKFSEHVCLLDMTENVFFIDFLFLYSAFSNLNEDYVLLNQITIVDFEVSILCFPINLLFKYDHSSYVKIFCTPLQYTLLYLYSTQ
jgi:hypothetical protein